MVDSSAPLLHAGARRVAFPDYLALLSCVADRRSSFDETRNVDSILIVLFLWKKELLKVSK